MTTVVAPVVKGSVTNPFREPVAGDKLLFGPWEVPRRADVGRAAQLLSRTGQKGVYAPEDGTVLVAATTNDGIQALDKSGTLTSILYGNGPAFVYLRGKQTGYWHLLGGLADVARTAGVRAINPAHELDWISWHDEDLVIPELGAPYEVKRGDLLGTMSGWTTNRLWWELQTAPYLPSRADFDSSNIDALGWYRDLGWTDPVQWLRDINATNTDPSGGVDITTQGKGDSAAGLVLIVLLGLAFLRRK